jgi:AraC family transcriptional regulator of adaptative response / DNA-3-methyladenine glycosylase II
VRNSAEGTHLVLRAHVSRFDGLVHLVQLVRRQFDLEANPAVVDAFLARDARLRPLVRLRRGLRVPGSHDPFELGVRAILGQQVTVAGATRLAGHLVELLGTPVAGLDSLGLTHVFPRADDVRDGPVEKIGLTTARVRAVRAYAEACASGALSFDGGPGLDGLVASLTALDGIGPWTAQYIAMRAAGERDAFPAGDLGLRRALGAPSNAAVATAAEPWRPWRAYAAMHLWSAPTPKGA